MASYIRACAAALDWAMAIPKLPERPKELDKPLPPEEDKPGTNETQHHPDPRAEPIPAREETWHPRSPYTTGND
jgi:hypothetical protein